MPKKWKKYQKKSRSMFSKPKKTRLNTVKKMVGDQPETMVEKISRWGGALGTVAGTVARIMSLINVETKYLDTTQTYIGVDNAGTYQMTLNSLPQGTGENQRIGESVVNSNLIIQYGAKINASATASIIRVIVFYDKKPEVGAVTATDLLATAKPTALLNKDNGDRFIILRSLLIPLGSASRQSVSGKVFIPLNKIHSQWNSSSTNDFEKGRIYLLAIADEATNQPSLEIQARLNFFDN